MKVRAQEITNIYLSKMEEILEFRAFTQFSYLQFNSAIANGFKVTTHLEPIGKVVNQEQIHNKIAQYEASFLPKLSLQHSVSIFESWLFDLLRHLLSDKNRLNKNRKIEVVEITNSSSLEDLLSKVIESELNEIKYKKPTDWFTYLNKFVDINLPTTEEIEKISEIKASRDVLVHNEGISNSKYIEKSGKFTRAPEGKELCFDHNYVYESWRVLNKVIAEVGKAVSKKIDT